MEDRRASSLAISEYIKQEMEEAQASGELMNESSNLMEMELAQLNRTTLHNMTIDDLAQLHKEVTALRRDGEKEYKEWDARNRQELDDMKRPLLAALGGPKRTDKKGVIIPGRTQRGADVSTITKAFIEAHTPARVFDRMDDFADFEGPFHSLFMRRVDSAEDAYLRAKDKRNSVMARLMKEHGITENKLMENLPVRQGHDDRRYREADPRHIRHKRVGQHDKPSN